MDPRDPGVAAGFVAALLSPDAPAPAGLGAGGGGKRLDIYRNNLAVGFREALAASFPAVRRLVGDSFFAALARAYRAASPPRTPVLFEHGADFGAFLERFPPTAGLPYLGDVARLEWARLRAYHAADAAALPIEALAGIAEGALPGLRVTLHPSLDLLRSRHPVVSIWQGLDRVDLQAGEDALTLRAGLAVETRRLPPGGAAFVAALARSAALAVAAQEGGEADPEFNLAHHLAGLFAAGAVIALHPETPS